VFTCPTFSTPNRICFFFQKQFPLVTSPDTLRCGRRLVRSPSFVRPNPDVQDCLFSLLDRLLCPCLYLVLKSAQCRSQRQSDADYCLLYADNQRHAIGKDAGDDRESSCLTRCDSNSHQHSQHKTVDQEQRTALVWAWHSVHKPKTSTNFSNHCDFDKL
jgi:hypothetical protein